MHFNKAGVEGKRRRGRCVYKTSNSKKRPARLDITLSQNTFEADKKEVQTDEKSNRDRWMGIELYLLKPKY